MRKLDTMTLTYFTDGAGGAQISGKAEGMVPPPILIELPMIKIPRSAARQYSDSELSTATAMLAKMRSRRDVIDHLRDQEPAAAFDADRTLDVVVERLLNAM